MSPETAENCAKCFTSNQSYNGRRYCNKHHPQRFCGHCGENANKFLKHGERCGNCLRVFMEKHQLPLPFDGLVVNREQSFD